MAINQTPGEIYFVRELDLLTHEVSRYVKVGLVRESDGRSSLERLDEHQTGNPRRLTLEKVIKTPAVSAVEGMLHGLFAANRVSGEWFDFDEKTLQDCIREAERLQKEVVANIEIISEAARLKDVPSTDEIKQPNKEIEDHFSNYIDASFCLSQCKNMDAEIRELLIEAEQKEENVQHLIEKQERKGRTVLDKEALQKNHPDVFSRFLTVETKISGKVTFAKVDLLENSMGLLGPDVDQCMHEIYEAINKVSTGQAPIDSLQDHRLRLEEFTSASEWHQEIAIANIKAFCGNAKEIEGIFKWPRIEVSKEVFNEKLFKESEPDLYAQYSSVGKDVVAHKVKLSKANPNKPE